MPSTTCCVPRCSKTGGHVFPKDKVIRKKWLVAIRRDKWSPTKNSVVCSNHFTAEDYVTETYRGCSPLYRRLKKTAFPTKFAWTRAPESHALAREQRANKRGREESLQLNETPTVAAYEEIVETTCIDAEEPVVTDLLCDQQTQTYNSSIHCKDGQSQTPRHTGNGILQISAIMNDDESVHLYTGLETYRKFAFVLHTLGPSAYSLTYMYGAVKDIAVEHQFLMVLMKLRRHTTNCELSKFFGISEADVYNLFCTWVRFMSCQWEELNIWPSQDLVRFYCPTDFKVKYPTTRVVLDGTEIPINKPSLPLAQQATYSTYKNRNTVKVVVGSTPGGLVTYVSPGYGDSTSDRHILNREECCDLYM